MADNIELERLKVTLRNNCERAYRQLVSVLYIPEDGEPQNSIEAMMLDLYQEVSHPDAGDKGSSSAIKAQLAKTITGIQTEARNVLLERLHGKVPQALVNDSDGLPFKVVIARADADVI